MRRIRGILAGSVILLMLVMLAPAGVVAQETSTPSVSPAADATGGAGGDTAAVAINTRDGSDIFRLAFAIKRAMGDVVDNGNAAVAYSSCTDCQTVAVSIQVVLMMNDPSIVTPTNLAIAINQQCTLCESLASAFQVILTTDGPVRFTADGYREIAEIRRELLALRNAGLSIEQILVQLDELLDRFFRVLMEELVEAGAGDPSAVPTPSADDVSASVSPPASSSPTATAAPTSSPTVASPSASETPSPTPSP